MSGWQSIPFHINPNIIEIGSFQLRYYSLMYLVAFGLVYLLVQYRIKKENYAFKIETIQDYFIWAILGVILGGRLGYVLFYNFGYYMSHPLEIILPFEFSNGIRFTGISGMSYHGGVLGFILATVLFCRKAQIPFWRFVDLLVPVIPLGYTFGRIGNFINGELYGRATDAPWGMVFRRIRKGCSVILLNCTKPFSRASSCLSCSGSCAGEAPSRDFWLACTWSAMALYGSLSSFSGNRTVNWVLFWGPSVWARFFVLS